MILKSSKQKVILIKRECHGFQYFNGKPVSKDSHSLALIGDNKDIQVVALSNVMEEQD